MKVVSMMRLLVGAASLLDTSGSRAADSTPASAAAVADQFLSGISSCDLAEREKLLAGVFWPASLIEHPAFVDVATLREGAFDTDTVGVQGYERLVRVTVPLHSGARFTRTYRLVAYPDRRSGRWKIWSFEEGGDIEAGLAFWRERVRQASPAEERSVTVRYAQSLGSSGRLRDALEVYLYVIESNGDDEGTPSQAHLTDAVRSLSRIAGSEAPRLPPAASHFHRRID